MGSGGVLGFLWGMDGAEAQPSPWRRPAGWLAGYDTYVLFHLKQHSIKTGRCRGGFQDQTQAGQ